MTSRIYLIINGPNLNLLGTREPQLYGNEKFENFFNRKIIPLQKDRRYKVIVFQSNYEGAIIDKLHETLNDDFKIDGIIINAGAYTHTSLAIADAISSINIPVVEVHISHIFKREEIRQKSLIAPNCIGMISGFGLDSYLLALEALENFLEEKCLNP